MTITIAGKAVFRSERVRIGGFPQSRRHDAWRAPIKASRKNVDNSAVRISP